nr:histidine kinase [uncultured Acetatifactor sp.]
MDSIKERLKLSAVSLRQFLIMLVFAGGVMFVFLFREMVQRMDNQEQEVVSEMQTKLHLMNLYIDSYCDSIQNGLMGITLRQDLYEKQGWESYYALEDIRKSNGFIQTLYVAGPDGEIYASQQALYDAVKPDIVDDMIDRARDNPGRLQYSKPVYSAMSAGYSLFVSYRSGDNIAVTETGCDYLRTMFQDVLGGQGKSFMVREYMGEPFLFSREDPGIELKPGVYPLEVADRYLKMFDYGKESAELASIEAVPEYSFLCTADNKLGWEVCLMYPADILQGYRSELFWFTAKHMGLWFAGIIIIVFWFTMLYTNPMRKLARDMDQVNDLEHLVEVHYSREDELGRLSSHYNSLVRRLRELVEEVRDAEHRKMEYEFLMLQNQIGPHFLHNTLACVASLIRQGKDETAGQALRALIKLLSYTFEQNAETVTIREEMEQLGNYVRIQQMRYGSGIRFEQQIEEGAAQCRVLKLLLQPLAENSIFHGIVPGGGGSLKIAARLRRGILHIFICDDGIGMTRNMCQDILDGKYTARVTDRLSSVGILNVNERMKLWYGEEYGIKIKSEIGVGTVIYLRIPQEKE